MRKIAIALTLVLLSAPTYAARIVRDGPLPAADDYTVLAGKVTIATIDDHTIGVVVDDGGPYRHLFRLWTSTAVNPFRATSQNASVEFRGAEVVVMAADQEWFYALVTNSSDTNTPRPPIGFTGSRYVGYGLNHEIRPIAAKSGGSGRHNVVALDDCSDGMCPDNLDFGLDAGGGGGSCNSGGLGSTSCSISNSYGSCSTVCMSNTYACCTNATSTTNASCRCKVY
jgi:hypothetical protein